MKNVKIMLFLSIFLMMTGCENINNSSLSNNVNNKGSSSSSNTNNIISTSSKNNNEEIYKVTFKDGSKIIYETEGKSGSFVNIPDDLISDEPRIEFKGGTGIDEYDMKLGKIEIFEEDQVFNAIWSERFGTDKVFNATKLNSQTSIELDGQKDEAYNNATEIPIETVYAGETDTTAKAYLMWDETYLYVFVDVKDKSVFGIDLNYNEEQAIEHYDSLELWIDLLHDDYLAVPGYKEGWGGDYRGEPGPMCEAHYKISAGYTPKEDERFGLGSEACWDGWWSNDSNNDGVSVGYSKITNEGYTVEYKINAANKHIPQNLRLKENEQIGVGIKIFDKNIEDNNESNKKEEAPNQIVIEEINGNMVGPKKLSNVNLVSSSYN